MTRPRRLIERTDLWVTMAPQYPSRVAALADPVTALVDLIRPGTRQQQGFALSVIPQRYRLNHQPGRGRQVDGSGAVTHLARHSPAPPPHRVGGPAASHVSDAVKDRELSDVG